jgi:hypothetical protein
MNATTKTTILATLLGLFLIGGNVQAQSKANEDVQAKSPIVGIGEFTLGMTESDFLQLPIVSSKTIKPSSMNCFYLTDATLMDILSQCKNSMFKSTFKSEIFTRTGSPDEVSYATTYDAGVSKNKVVLYAIFFKEVLVEVQIRSLNDFKNYKTLLSDKYGEPKLIGEIKYTTCQNGYGATFEKLDGTESSHWQHGKNKAKLVQAFANCAKFYISSYEVSDVEGVRKKEEAAKEARKSAEAEKLKQQSTSSKL